MTPLRLIVVGLGARARTWLQVVGDNPDIEIVAFCDPDPNARSRAADQFPDLPIGEALDDVIGTEADAVLLCTPPSGREAQIAACCSYGLAILAEKPLSDDVATAARFVEMAEAASVPLIVGLNFRYLGVTQAMRRLLTERAIGKPEFGRFIYERWRDGTQDWLNSYPLTMDHPMLWEQSIHHFDLMRYVYGTEPASIQAHTFNPSWTMYQGDTNVSALIAFENGMTVNYQGTWQSGHEPMNFNWRTDGSEGIVVQREMFGDLAFARRMEPDLTPIPLPDHKPWISDATALLASFVATCRGTAPPECTGRDHLQSLFMLQACILASDRRAAVEIEEVRTDATARA
ncbi:Gfo/Idh/MocA family oxidoreductase [Roseobacter sp. HKCCD9010]|uniref:Gfo/Idh/MocA family protein n=1 Tax=unclassified Roseobacter TaxID=196798 RepID=UPI0014915EB4|nr:MULTISPECIES: Gfo/Idh/MocA family oxidoreductase [unclassified Roseobacter]MBF9049841.1 Gfo/Idh/MocA family oxidoreductase [Rhodobacterales bacterium HKCCD4356]NNV13620.1 Gfo/Idh/MocA family oxidoreductase [Roseobacter sp. HKCCD7357]NNV16454.1 Gfo/Idh/MocA family oxidoreductase [Roseobacter sp. HKCCD8768]NNV25913.1 Gfo/Idh/MocA family oxidoreductase [Roseobacter sp. HKCCD8192]NNV30171.1 Gfo/Idh/MocA family oxidoreductase [Roseobacter sp. HKCCD9061]